MTGFLKKMQKQVDQMARNDELSLDDLPFIMSAFGNSSISLD
jgi:hypothetical protein